MIKVYHTDNGIFNISNFIEDILKKQKNIRFSEASASHQNGESERTINLVVTVTSTMLVLTAPICHKELFSNDYFQWKYTILYGYILGSLICSMVYGLLDKFEPYMFWSQFYIIMDLKSLNGLQGVKEGLIWYSEGFIQNKLGWL